MSDQHKFIILNNESIKAYIMDKTAGSELVIIDKKSIPPQVGHFNLLEKDDIDQLITNPIGTVTESINSLNTQLDGLDDWLASLADDMEGAL